MATIKEIAELTGLSINTVSRALRKSGYVSADAAKKVGEAAKKLHYHPNRAARNLRNHSSDIVMIIAESADLLNIEKITAIQQEAATRNMTTNVFLISPGNYHADVCRVRNLVFEERPAGVIVIGGGTELLRCAESLKSEFPLVLISYDLNENFSCVYIDRAGGVESAVKYLYQSGRRRIAFAGIESAGKKYNGYLKTVHELGLPEIRLQAVIGSNIPELRNDCKKLIAELKNMDNPPDAIQCSDFYAAALSIEMLIAGIKVPEKFAIVGFDNRDFTQYCQPPLTTIAQPNFEVGQQACRLLFELMNDNRNENFRKIKIPMQLIIRQST